MASEKKPVKGILKSSTSFDKGGEQNEKREMKWDEMSILATYHPPGKDYGHMKIDEPPTPYSNMLDGSDEENEDLDPETLAKRLEKDGQRRDSGPLEDYSSEEEEELTEEERAKKKKFELKRKLHYNEFHAVKLGKQLLEQEDEEDEDEEETSTQQPSQ